MSRHKDPVSPDMREAVFGRDRRFMAAAMEQLDYGTIWVGGRLMAYAPHRSKGMVVCPAAYIEVAQLGKCWGRWTLDHIRSQPRLGRRAPSDMAHLISLCQSHMEDGMKAGHQWNTANRPAIRKYLEEVNHMV